MPEEALPTRSVFAVPGMDCPTEEQLVRMALSEVEDVRSLEFDLDGRQLEAIHIGPPVTILSALEPLAMGAHLLSSEAVDPHTEAASRDPESAATQRRALWFVLAINAVMFAIELVAGLVADSTGLVADSLDMLADATIYAIALVAAGNVTRQRRSARASGWLQLMLAGLVLVEVVRRAASGSEPADAVMVAVGLLALLANLTCVAILSRHRRGGAHMRASWIFTTNDALANIGVIVAGLLVAVTGSAVPDLVIGAMITALVASGAWRILRMG